MTHSTLHSRQFELASRWLVQLCRIDSTSGRERALLPALRPILSELGGRVEEQAVAGERCNLLASWGEPRVLFSTHLDTVPPHIPPVARDGIIHGRGSCDAKGQIVAQLLAIGELLAAGVRDVAWLGVAGEETDAAGAHRALDLAPRFGACRVLINGEPTELSLATGQRGVQHLRLSCRGRAAHSGTPELGRSALWSLLDWLQRLRALPRPVDDDLGPEVWNLGKLEGGEAINVVSTDAVADLLVRTIPGSRFLADVMASKPPEGTVAEVYGEPPVRFRPVAGFPSRTVTFGSDAVTLRHLVPNGAVVLAGPGSIAVAHTDDEHLSLDDLIAGVELNRRLASAFLADGGRTEAAA